MELAIPERSYVDILRSLVYTEFWWRDSPRGGISTVAGNNVTVIVYEELPGADIVNVFLEKPAGIVTLSARVRSTTPVPAMTEVEYVEDRVRPYPW